MRGPPTTAPAGAFGVSRPFGCRGGAVPVQVSRSGDPNPISRNLRPAAKAVLTAPAAATSATAAAAAAASSLTPGRRRRPRRGSRRPGLRPCPDGCESLRFR